MHIFNELHRDDLFRYLFPNMRDVLFTLVAELALEIFVTAQGIRISGKRSNREFAVASRIFRFTDHCASRHQTRFYSTFAQFLNPCVGKHLDSSLIGRTTLRKRIYL